MSALAEDSIEPTSWAARLLKVGGALMLVGLLIAAAFYLRKLAGEDTAPKRQIAKITILPDTPPPPPPPPKDNKPPPETQSKPMPDAPLKPAEVPQPANAPLKMEGEAGEGASAFAAGTVNKEYSGGAVSTGAAQAGGSGTSSDRAQERFFANTARQLLRDAIERHLKSDATQATAEFSLWIARDGGITRFELRPTGDGRLDSELNAALDETTRALKLPPPPVAAAQPMKFRLNVRPLG